MRDGSTKEDAIPLKQRGAKAVEEEMAWMMKIHGYTPVLATEKAIADLLRQMKTGKQKNGKLGPGWEHATLWHGRQWCSYWSFVTPRGRKKCSSILALRLTHLEKCRVRNPRAQIT
ncbi:MAG: hypothetical protein H0T11_06155 [Chthoniobacterales bacterium]|nr:hypothetical protein [Chthoniobacterales bacterium]